MHAVYRAVLLLAIASISVLLPLPAKEIPWKKLQSEHFEIFTQDNPKNARKVLQHLEQVRAAYEALTNSRIERPGKGRVIQFRSKTEYEPYAPSSLAAAFYVNARRQDYIVMYPLSTESERVLNHEYFHLFSNHADFGLPVWLEEGIADYFSTLKITGKEIQVGLPVIDHLRYLNQNALSLAPLRTIFSMERRTRYDADRRSTMQLYAQGWALAHMTFLSKEMMSRAGEYFKAVREGGDAEAVYLDTYGTTLEDLDRLLSSYVRRRSYSYYKHPVAGLNATAPVEESPIEPWEGPLLLASLQIYTHRDEQAAQSLSALAAEYPEVPEIAETQGYLALREMDRASAGEHFKRAAAIGSKNSNLYFDLVSITCRYSEYNEQCQKWANEALRLDPTHREARRWVVGYVLNAKKFDHALAYLMRAGTVKPADAPEHFTQIAYASAGLRRFDEARSAIGRGLQYAKSSEEIARLNSVRARVDSAEQQDQQMQEAQLFGPPQPRSSPLLPPIADPEDRPWMRRDGQPPTRHHGSNALNEALRQFADEERLELASAVLRAMNCGEPSILSVVVDGEPVLLTLDDPLEVRVFHGGEPVADHEFTCGAQPETRVLVGYITDSKTEGITRLLRILSFE